MVVKNQIRSQMADSNSNDKQAPDNYPNNIVTPVSQLTLGNWLEMLLGKPRGYYK